MDYDRWLLNQADKQEESKMGYRSQVVIELKGKTEDVMVILNTYKLSESPQDIEAANHILETGQWKPDFFVEQTAEHLDMTWCFDDVKWYEESEQAFERLANIVDEMNLDVALYLTRVGEDEGDIETKHVGATHEYDKDAYITTSIQTDYIHGKSDDFATFKLKEAA